MGSEESAYRGSDPGNVRRHPTCARRRNTEVGVDWSWHASHPNGVMNGHLQVLASDGPVWQFRSLGTTHEPADSSWRVNHSNGLTLPEVQTMSLDAPASHPSDPAGDPANGPITRAWVYQISATNRSSANCVPTVRFYGLLCPAFAR
jgi:hypothetical protein